MATANDIYLLFAISQNSKIKFGCSHDQFRTLSKFFKVSISSQVCMITNKGSSKKPTIFYLDARNPTGINLMGLARKFNSEKGDTASTAFETLRELSERLCAELSSKYQRVSGDGRPSSITFENLCWAASLILSSWLGLTLESKSIRQAGEPNPTEEHLLYFEVIPSVLNAFKQGIEQAVSDKRN